MYQEGTILSDKEFADYTFKMNMYLLINYKHPFDPYKWKRLDLARKKLADIYYDAVDRWGEDVFLNSKKGFRL